MGTGEPDLVHQTLENSPAALGLDYVDLYLLHGPVASAGLPPAGWKAMEELYAAGLTRAIRVCNLMADHLDRLLTDAVVVPAVNQLEIHPTFQQQELAAKSRTLGSAVGACNPSGRDVDLDDGTVRYLDRQIRRHARPDHSSLAPYAPARFRSPDRGSWPPWRGLRTMT